MAATELRLRPCAHSSSFRDEEACARVRAIPRDGVTRHAEPGLPDPRRRRARRSSTAAFADDLVGRIRQARDEGRQFVAILPVGPMPQYALAARMINEERLSLAARAHVQHGRVRERGRARRRRPRGRARSSGRCGSASSRSSTPELRPPERRSTSRPPKRSATTAQADRGRSAAPTSATAGSAGAATSRSGSRTSGTSSKATSTPTSRPAPGSSSYTR